jgi:hypothetical protein
MAVALFKDCNAGLDHLGRSFQASREAAVRGVAPLGKGDGHSLRGVPCGPPLPNSLHP